ncbi:MAG: hypothetical protein ACREJD_07810 [Phycisphaerales bacterium]
MSEPPIDTGTRSDPTAVRSEPFRLNAFSIGLAILVVLGGLYIAIRGATVNGLDSYNTGGAVGGAIGTLIVPLAVAWCGYRGVRRSNFVGNSLFIAMLVIGLMGQGGIAFRRAQAQKSLGEIDALAKETNAANAAGDTARAHQLAAQTAEKTREAAANAGGVEKQVLEYSASFIKRSNDASKAYHDELNTFTKAGGETCAGLVDEAAFEKRFDLLDKAINAQENLQKFFTGLDERVATEMKAQGLTEKAIAGYVRGLTQGGRLETVVRTQELEGDMLNMMGARLEILYNNLGNWTCGDDGVVTFGADCPPEALQKFNELAKAIAAATAEQAELQSRIIQKK